MKVLAKVWIKDNFKNQKRHKTYVMKSFTDEFIHFFKGINMHHQVAFYPTFELSCYLTII